MAIREPIDWPGSRPNSSVWRCHYHGKLQMRMDPTLSNKKTRWLQRTGRVELYLNDDFWGSLGSGSSPSASSSTFATLAFKQLQWQFIKWCQQGRNVGLARYSFILNSCMVSSVALQILVTHALLSKKFQICMPFFFPRELRWDSSDRFTRAANRCVAFSMKVGLPEDVSGQKLQDFTDFTALLRHKASSELAEVTFYALQILGGKTILAVSMWFRLHVWTNPEVQLRITMLGTFVLMSPNFTRHMWSMFCQGGGYHLRSGWLHLNACWRVKVKEKRGGRCRFVILCLAQAGIKMVHSCFENARDTLYICGSMEYPGCFGKAYFAHIWPFCESQRKSKS